MTLTDVGALRMPVPVIEFSLLVVRKGFESPRQYDINFVVAFWGITFLVTTHNTPQIGFGDLIGCSVGSDTEKAIVAKQISVHSDLLKQQLLGVVSLPLSVKVSGIW